MIVVAPDGNYRTCFIHKSKIENQLNGAFTCVKSVDDKVVAYFSDNEFDEKIPFNYLAVFLMNNLDFRIHLLDWAPRGNVIFAGTNATRLSRAMHNKILMFIEEYYKDEY